MQDRMQCKQIGKRLRLAPASASSVKPNAASVQTLGPISVDEVYPLEVFKEPTGLAGWALRAARRAQPPLRVTKVGRRSFVTGKDFASYLDSLSAMPEQS